MPRTSKGPRYYASKGGWFATFNGELIRLATGPERKTKKEAETRYEAEKQARKVEVAGDRNTVWAICNAYLADCQNRMKLDPPTMSQNTYEIQSERIAKFSEHCGSILVRDLRPQHITDWLAHMQQERWSEHHKRMLRWGPSTVKQGKNAVKAAFLWAYHDAGLISRNPFEKRMRGKKDRRQRRRPVETKVAITDQEHAALLEQAKRRSKKGFYHLLQFLHRTGARPAEMYLAKASEWDERRQAFVIKASPENEGRYKLWYLGEDRVLYVPSDLVPLVKELMKEHPEGPLFRTGSGRAWTPDTICARFACTKRAVNGESEGEPIVRKEITAYSYRHAFVTRWVMENKPLNKLCELLNTSEAMIRQHYSHLFEQTASLREALDDFDRGTAAQPATQDASPAKQV